MWRRRTLSLFLAFTGLVVQACAVSPVPAAPVGECELLVLASPDDPYYPLAEEIAAEENVPLAHSFQELAACQPLFLLWVVSPAMLSDAAMVEFGLAMEAHNLTVAPGIITASTLEGARTLWQRRSLVGGEDVFAANAPNPAAHIYQGQLLDFSAGRASVQPLTGESFTNALRRAAYLTFTGHGSSRYLKLDENTPIEAANIPELDAPVIGTGSCQTLRPWIDNSIALRFIDQGAAVYAGFVFSPNEGYLIGEFDGLPLRYTWPGFTIGQALQVQNRGARQGFAAFPFLFLLGDPRSALQPEPPYRLVDDRLAGDARILRYENVPAGAVPFSIAGGAAYRYVAARGITSAADQDPFYNSRLQMINVREDKLLLLVHPGGDLELELRPRAPGYWFALDGLLDSLDHTFVFSQQTGGDLLSLAFACLPLSWAGWQALRRRFAGRALRLSLAVGVGFASLQAAYALLRLEHVTITSKAVVFNPLGILAGFVLAACGALVYLHTRSAAGKAAGLLVVTFQSWSATAFGLLAIAAFNMFASVPKLGVTLYNYSIGLLPVGSLLATLALSWLALRKADRLLEK